MAEKDEVEEKKEQKEVKKELTSPFQMRIPIGLLDFFKDQAKEMDVSLNNYMLYMMIEKRENSTK